LCTGYESAGPRARHGEEDTRRWQAQPPDALLQDDRQGGKGPLEYRPDIRQAASGQGRADLARVEYLFPDSSGRRPSCRHGLLDLSGRYPSEHADAPYASAWRRDGDQSVLSGRPQRDPVECSALQLLVADRVLPQEAARDT